MLTVAQSDSDSDYQQILASRLQRLIDDRYATRAEFAKAIGRTEMWVSRRATGQSALSADDVVAVCAHFGISSDALLGLATQARGSGGARVHLLPLVEWDGVSSDVAVAQARAVHVDARMYEMLFARDADQGGDEADALRFAATVTPDVFEGEAVGPRSVLWLDRRPSPYYLQNTLCVVIGDEGELRVRRCWERGEIIVAVSSDLPPLLVRRRSQIVAVVLRVSSPASHLYGAQA